MSIKFKQIHISNPIQLDWTFYQLRSIHTRPETETYIYVSVVYFTLHVFGIPVFPSKTAAVNVNLRFRFRFCPSVKASTVLNHSKFMFTA